MRNTFRARKIELLFALLFAVFPAGFAAAQSNELLRPRIVAKPQTAPAPMPTPALAPTPNVSPTPKTAAPRIAQTLTDLQTNIRRALQNPALARAQVGVKIVSLDSGKTLFEENAEKYFMPASNMKSFTVAAALDRLTPDFRFVTSVYVAAPPDASGTIRGDVVIFGRGDPTFAASLNDGDYFRAINLLADKIAASNVKRIEGNLVGDESYFTGDAIGASWEWDDLQWYYGAEISALTVNDNAVDIRIVPGAKAGAPLVVQILPLNSLFAINNLTATAPTRGARQIEITKRLGANVLDIRGTMPVGDKEYSGAIAVTRPAEMFVALLKNALLAKGVQVAGQTRVVGAKDKQNPINQTIQLPPPQIEIARFESAPLAFIAAKTLKPSQNLYTELILRALGESAGDKANPKKTSAELGLEVVQKFLTEAGIQPDSVVQWDGSGLSRHNLITPNAAAKLYETMSRHRFAAAFAAAQPIGAVDGTLKNRFVNTAAANNVRAKTGTIDQVATLSGYATTASGERIAFSILTNALPDTNLRRKTIDDIVLLLTNFNGKSE